jgi:lysozyme family protein
MNELFNKCYDHLLKNEGGYANHPNDKGGETYKGIARKYHSDWEGWELIDQYKKNKNGFPENAYQDSELDKMVREFYKEKFWDKMDLDLIVNENTVLQLFDMGVNAGIKTAVKLAQKACDAGLIVDGIIGVKTAFEINHWGHLFADRYIEQRIIYYNEIVRRNPSQSVFLNGWCKRAKNTKF